MNQVSTRENVETQLHGDWIGADVGQRLLEVLGIQYELGESWNREPEEIDEFYDVGEEYFNRMLDGEYLVLKPKQLADLSYWYDNSEVDTVLFAKPDDSFYYVATKEFFNRLDDYSIDSIYRYTLNQNTITKP